METKERINWLMAFSLALCVGTLCACGGEEEKDDDEQTPTGGDVEGMDRHVGVHTADVFVSMSVSVKNAPPPFTELASHTAEGITITASRTTAENELILSFSSTLKIPTLEQTEQNVSFQETLEFADGGASYRVKKFVITSGTLGRLVATKGFGVEPKEGLAHAVTFSVKLPTEDFPDGDLKTHFLLLGKKEIPLKVEVGYANWTAP